MIACIKKGLTISNERVKEASRVFLYYYRKVKLTEKIG